MQSVSIDLASLLDARVISKMTSGERKTAEAAVRLSRELRKILLSVNFISEATEDRVEGLDTVIPGVDLNDIQNTADRVHGHLAEAGRELQEMILMAETVLHVAAGRVGGAMAIETLGVAVVPAA